VPKHVVLLMAVMNCVLLGAFVGECVGCKNMHGMNNNTNTTNKSVGAVLQIGRSMVRSQLVSLDFFIDIKSFRSHYGPGVDSTSNGNECQEHFLGVKGADA